TGAGVDEYECGHQLGPLLGKGGGDYAAAGMTDNDGALDAEPVQGRADPVCLPGDLVVAVGRFVRPSVPGQVEPNDVMGRGQQRNQWVPRTGRGGGPVDEQERGGVLRSVLTDVHVAVLQGQERSLGGSGVIFQV